MVLIMADLKDKINYITNQFSAGKPAFTGEASNEFLIGVMNELSSDESNYAEFKDSIPAIHKAVMDELKVATPDTKHLLVASALKNSGITSTLKEENITQKPIFVEFLINKAQTESNDALHDEVSALMDHAFDETNKRIEVSSLITIASKCISTSKYDENDVVSRFLASEKFSDKEYVKFYGGALAFNNMNFDYDLTDTQSEALKGIVLTLADARKESFKDPSFKLDSLLTEATEKYSKFFFSNDLDIEAQLHKVRAEDSLSLSAGMISGNDLGTPIKDVLKEQAAKKAEQEADQAKFDLIMSWEERYNDYLKKLSNVRVMSSGDKFKKRFAQHGFAPATANMFGDSVVSCDSYGDPTATLWNISPLTGSMKLSRDMRYDDPAGCQQAFTIAALNARRQGWDSIFLNHPGPDREAKEFIKHSFNAMVDIGDYSFDSISVPKRYQHVLDKLIADAMTGTLKNNATVTDEVRNAPSTRAEQSQTSPESTAEASTPSPVDSDTQTPADKTTASPVADSSQEEVVVNENNVPESENTHIPSAFDQTDDLAFDITEQSERTVVEPVDEFEAARNEEIAFETTEPDYRHESEPERFEHDHEQYIPEFNKDEADILANQSFDIGEISYELPEDLRNEQKDSLEGYGATSPEKQTNGRKNGPGKIKLS